MPASPESAIYGARWDSFHGGYFADPAVAAPLADAIVATARKARPTAIADLGGGTGFVLSRLDAHGLDSHIRLVNLDTSHDQLAQARERNAGVPPANDATAHFVCLTGSIAEFLRAHVAQPGDRVLWAMRSALHYFGETGLPAVLRHLRAQARPGEWFVHQTACFDRARDADCLNTLYREMATGKWYPTTDQLHRLLAEAGWHVHESEPAPALPLSSSDLATRYNVAPDAMRQIRDTLARQFGAIEGVLDLDQDGFCAHLHYRIVRCSTDSCNGHGTHETHC